MHTNIATSPTVGIRRGFTLIEILVVVVILGFASAIILPQIGSRDDLKAAAAARVIIADLTYAQNRAISTQQTQYVRFELDKNPQVYSLGPSTVLTQFTQNPISKDNYIRTFGAGGTPGLEEVSLVDASTSFDGAKILAFDALGQPWSVSADATALLSSGQIVVQCGKEKLTLTVEPFTGEITIN
jgi:prepilin-type N-terminal cleavage/methylation domain-containing protein